MSPQSMQPRRLSTRITPSSCLRLLAAAAAAGVLGTAAACSDDANPAAPSALSSPAAPSSGGSPAAGRAALQPVRAGDVDTVAPGDARYGPNAYDFFATWDGSALNVALVEDAMAGMRRASQPHRMRAIEVFHCNSEPRHVLQTCGAPLYSGTLQLAGRLELPPIDLAACASREWLVVTAAELSDDRYDGWRNAPCPRPNGVAVGSDGTGPGWDRGEHGPPERNFPEPEPEPEAEPAPTPPSGPAPTPPSGPAPTPPSGPAPDPDPPSGPAPTPPSGPAPTPPSGPAPTPPSGPAPTPDPPSGPAPTPPPAPAPDPAAPSWFSSNRYDALVYGVTDGPAQTNAFVLGDAATTLNVLFYHVGRLRESPSPGLPETCAIPASVVNPLAQATGGAIRAATGGSWSGRTELTTDVSRVTTALNAPGWSVVVFEHNRLSPEYSSATIATAVIGEPSGGIQIFIDDSCSPRAPDLLSTYVHELGHVLGFFHVPDSSWLMHQFSVVRTQRGSYAPDERRHMQRAYELGPDYPRTSPVWSLLPPDPLPGRRPPRKRIVILD